MDNASTGRLARLIGTVTSAGRRPEKDQEIRGLCFEKIQYASR